MNNSIKIYPVNAGIVRANLDKMKELGAQLVESGVKMSIDDIAKEDGVTLKPVYTQAMSEAGEFPAVGVTCEALIGKNWLQADVFAIFNGVCHVHLIDDDEYGFCRDAKDLRPIDDRTTEEKLIDDVASLISSKGVMHNLNTEATEIAQLLIESEFNITRRDS